MNVLLWCISGFLMVMGIAAVWEWMLLFFHRPKMPLLRYELVPLGGKVENMEQLLQYISLNCGDRIPVLLDLGLDDESWELCRRFCWQKNILLLKPKEMQTMIFAENELEEVENS